MIRKVRLPLKVKIITLIATLLLTSIAFYLFVALQLFEEDKSAYIFEDTLKTNELLSSVVQRELESYRLELQYLSKIENKEESFLSLKSFIDYGEYEITEEGAIKGNYFLNEEILTENGFPNTAIKEAEKRVPIPFSTIVNTDITLYPNYDTKVIPHFMMTMKNGSKIYTGRILTEKISKLLNQNKKFSSYIVSMDNKPFLNITEDELGSNKDVINKILQMHSDSGVFEITSQDNILASYKIIDEYNIIVISTIHRENAFLAMKYLIFKSKYFALFIISISVILGIFYAGRITKNLHKLSAATDNVSKGIFDKPVHIKSNDEIGALSDSFNIMSKEISRYMSEMEEKIRLDNELQVAKLVQESFFPNSEVKTNHFGLSAFYEPASECGGDWWSYMEVDNKLIVFIADATGHGVPAALLTATANCCVSNLREIAKTSKEILDSPVSIMNFMNKAVCDIGEDIFMTAFVGIIDFSTHKIKYTSASHNPPFLIDHTKEELNKNDLVPLMVEQGPRLGHVNDAQYESGEMDITQNHSLVLFTDGIIENTSPENKEFGNRRFFKTILNNIKQSSSEALSGMVDEIGQFYDGQPLDDDVTLIICKLTGATAEVNSSSDTKKDRAILTYTDDEFDKLSETDKNQPNLVLLSNKTDEENILEYYSKYSLAHIIGANSPDVEKELSEINMKKLLHHTDYTSKESLNIVEKILFNKDEIIKVTDDLVDQFDFGQMFTSPKDYIRQIANELLTNALRNDSNGAPVSLKLSKDDTRIILSVTDSFGELSIDKFKKAISRGFIEKTPRKDTEGAGLGLYVCLSFSNQLIVNLSPSNKTEILCIIDTNKRYKKYKERITSIHFNQLI